MRKPHFTPLDVLLLVTWILSESNDYLLQSHHHHQYKLEICYASAFGSFILLIILNTFSFTSFILLRTHFLPNGSYAALQLPPPLLILMSNG